MLRQVPDPVIIGLCTCGPVGRWGKAPGTNGTVLGLVLYTVLFHPLGLAGQLVLLAVLAAMAWAICDEGERRMQKRDPGEMILDEVVAVPLCFIGLSAQMAPSGNGIWASMLAGFLLFRFFDILKPLGINRLQAYPGGLGVVLDDLAAALATQIALRLIFMASARLGWSVF